MTIPAAQSLTNSTLMQRRVAAVARGVGQAHQIVVARAEGAELWDVEGRRYVDFTGGISVLNTGHRHPDVMAAVERQLQRYTHTCFQVVAYEPYIELAERLNALAPGPWPKKSLLLTTGAEAVENAVKIARAHTGRPGVISFAGGYHGRTNFTLGLTGKVTPYKLGFGPFPADLWHAPFPDAFQGVSVDDALAAVESLFKTSIEPARVAAFILEPVQGEGGFRVAPHAFVAGLADIARRHGILLIADEVQSGAGRTGTWFACEQWPVAPDLITTAKSLAGGFPLSGVVGRADVMDAAPPGGLGGTYAGSPVACAAALAVIDVFEREGLLARAAEIGRHLMRGLAAMAERHTCIADIRGLGAMVAFEVCKPGTGTPPDPASTTNFIHEAARRGLILLSCGAEANVVRIMVPLVASNALLDEGLAIIDASMDALR